MLNYRTYHFATSLISPFLPLWLLWRKAIGKEDPARLKERYGIASLPRPEGTLLWLHAASVGEATSVLLLIRTLREQFPDLQLLLTTGTVTSARLMQSRLPEGVIHQYAPLDTPQASMRFIRHWKPHLAFWVESEFWPNLVMAADYYQCFMGVINARMSQRSFGRWQKYPTLIGTTLACFNVVFAQSDEDGERLKALGAHEILSLGNLKYDAALLPCDEAELTRLKQAVGNRPLWLAASTHPGEEALIADAHKLLITTRPDLLTIIVPRHPERGGEIAQSLRKRLRVGQRSRGQTIATDTQIYIADTLGELGLFYRLSEIVFMGGSLVPHGGQNPLEPARLACAIIAGTHTQHFAAIYREMETGGLLLRAKNKEALAAQVSLLLGDPSMRARMQAGVRPWIESKGGAAGRIIDMLAPLLTPRKIRA